MKIVIFVVVFGVIQTLVKKKLQYIQQTSLQKGKFNIGLLKDRLQVLGKELIDLKKELKEANDILENNMTTTDNDMSLNTTDLSVGTVQYNNTSITTDDPNTKNIKNMVKRNMNQDINQVVDQNINKDSSLKKDEQNKQIMKMIQPQQIQEVNPRIHDELDEINRTIEHNQFNITNTQEDEHAKDLVIHIHKLPQPKDDIQIKTDEQINQRDSVKDIKNEQSKVSVIQNPNDKQEQKQSKDQKIVDQSKPNKDQKSEQQKKEQDDNQQKHDEQNSIMKQSIEPKSQMIQIQSSPISEGQQEEKIINDDFRTKFMNGLDNSEEGGHFMILDGSKSEQIVIHMK